MKKALKIQFLRIRELWPMIIVLPISFILGCLSSSGSLSTACIIEGYIVHAILEMDSAKGIEKQFFLLPIQRKYWVITQYLQWILITLILYASYLIGLILQHRESEFFLYLLVRSLFIPAGEFTGIAIGMAQYYCVDDDFPRDTFWVVVFCFGFMLLLGWSERFDMSVGVIFFMVAFSILLVLWTLYSALKSVKTREI